jgi:alanine racemase
MLKQNHRAWVEIDLTAVKHNVRQLKQLLAPSTELMAVVKADAYGHGCVGVSQAALEAGAAWLGVATIPEGIQLRNAGITSPIVILGATNSLDEIRAIAEYRLQPTICNPKQALVFHEILAEKIAPKLLVHLKIDTGMSRLGTDWQEAIEFVKLVHGLPQLEIDSVYSHLATADESDQTILRLQQQRFERVVDQLHKAGIYPPRLHLCNSAGMLVDRQLHYDLVRPGLCLYGLYPATHLREFVDLRPVMQLKARITQVKAIASGTGVSYGYSFVADRDMRIATVAIGYADGVSRGLSNQISVLVGDRKVAQIGTITMDQTLIDVTDVPEASVGDVVTFLGKGDRDLSVDRWAQILGTISWEILCGFKHRLPRICITQPDLVKSYL